MLIEYLKRCAEREAFPWTVVQSIHDVLQFFVRDTREIADLRRVVPAQPVHVFISASFPGGIRMSKEEIGFQFPSDPFVLGKLFAIIPGDRLHAIGDWLKQVNHGLADLLCCAPFDLPQQDQPRFSLRQGDDSLAMPFANDCIHFPVTHPLTLIDNLWARLDAHSIGQFSTSVITAIAFAALLLAAPM